MALFIPNFLSFLDDLCKFLFRILKNSLNDLSLSGVLILPLKIKEIKYRPSLSSTINREVVLLCLITLPLFSSF